VDAFGHVGLISCPVTAAYRIGTAGCTQGTGLTSQKRALWWERNNRKPFEIVFQKLPMTWVGTWPSLQVRHGHPWNRHLGKVGGRADTAYRAKAVDLVVNAAACSGLCEEDDNRMVQVDQPESEPCKEGAFELGWQQPGRSHALTPEPPSDGIDASEGTHI
jgi:hypothetical protein